MRAKVPCRDFLGMRVELRREMTLKSGEKHKRGSAWEVTQTHRGRFTLRNNWEGDKVIFAVPRDAFVVTFDWKAIRKIFLKQMGGKLDKEEREQLRLARAHRPGHFATHHSAALEEFRDETDALIRSPGFG